MAPLHGRQQQLRTLVASAAWHRCWHRPVGLDHVLLAQQLSCGEQERIGMLHLLRFGANQRQVREWRESCGLPLVQLRLCERVVTTADQGFRNGCPG